MSFDSRLEALESWLRLHRSRILLLIAAGALAVAAWLYRSPPTAVAEGRPRLEMVSRSPSPRPSPQPRRPGPSPTSPAARPSAAPAPLATSAQTRVWVHVAGAVARPGVVRLPLDARAFQAVQAAGGLLADADLDRVNLARRVEDGGMIVVPRRDDPAPGRVPGTPLAGAPTPGSLDLNAATADELAALPGLGPTRAAAIVSERERGGPYRSVADLHRVPGMGPRLVARIEPLVRVATPEEGAPSEASNRVP